MKKILLISTLALAMSASAAEETISSVTFSGDLDYSGFCKAVVNDDVNLLKRNIRSKVGVVAINEKGVLRRLVDENGMTCNGEDLVSFSIQRHSPDIQAYLTQAI
jgi:phosphoribulokinase